ncbi:MAG: hypothetical protein AAFZ65_04190, partial [Planctomycetota bacterium]
MLLACAAATSLACSGGGGGGSNPVSLAATISTPQSVSANEFVVLDGTESVGSVQTFAWRLLDPTTDAPFPAGSEPTTLIGADQAQASFLAPDANLTLRVELTVDDGSETAMSSTDIDVVGSLPISAIGLRSRFAPAEGLEGQAEISAFDPVTARVFSVSTEGRRLDAFNLSDPTAPSFVGTVEFGPGATGLPVGLPPSSPNSVAVYRAGGASRILVALENTEGADPQQQRGYVAFVDPASLTVDAFEQVGFLPDMVTVTPDGRFAVVANEGQPSDDYVNDPEGSVSIIPLDAMGNPSGPVGSADFTAFDGSEAA